MKTELCHCCLPLGWTENALGSVPKPRVPWVLGKLFWGLVLGIFAQSPLVGVLYPTEQGYGLFLHSFILLSDVPPIGQGPDKPNSH